MITSPKYKLSYLIGLCSYLFSIGCACSQDIQDIFNKNIDYLSKISSLSFQGTETHVALANPNLKQIITTRYTQSGDRFAFSIDQNFGEAFGGKMSHSAAYNGDVYQWSKGPFLIVKKGYPDEIPNLYGNIYIIKPFEFVRMALAKLANHHSSRFYELTPDQLKKAENWNLLKTGIQSISSGTIEGKQGIVVKLSGQYESRDFDISVLFDPSQQYYPIAWERTSTLNKDAREDYVVTKLGKMAMGNIVMPFPEEATLTKYFKTEKTAISTIIINKISTDEISPNDSQFTFDPALFNQIVDTDKNVLIAVPK